MNIPAIVTNNALRLLASPEETHEVHVIVRRLVNQAPYTLRGRRRQYVVSRDTSRNAHILIVPLSVWMHGINKEKPVMENDSIAYDLQATRTALKSPLTFEIWPVKKQAPQAIKIAEQKPVDDAPPPAAVPSAGESRPLTNAERQKLHRERKKAEKAAELQPA
jgi:hypothetical protein